LLSHELVLEEKRNGGNWEVRGTLNSQNKFGALLKANFLVVIRIENDGKKYVLYYMLTVCILMKKLKNMKTVTLKKFPL
jgi:hypothetical protein